MADDFLSLLTSLGSDWSTVDILGWSMGGHILQRLTTRSDDAQVDSKSGLIKVAKGRITVRKIVLAATLTKLPKGDLDMDAMQAEAEAIQNKEARKQWMTEQMLRYQYDEVSLGDPSSPLLPVLKHRIQVSLKTSRPQAIIAQQFLAISGLTLSQEDLARIPSSVDTLIIHGEKDRMVHPYMGKRLQEWIKHAKVVDLSDGPHGAKEHMYGHFVSHQSWSVYEKTSHSLRSCPFTPQWFDYYGTDYWVAKINQFLDQQRAKL